MEKLGYRECGVLVVGELWSSDLGEKENPSPYHGFGEDGDTHRATVWPNGCGQGLDGCG